MLKPFRYSGSKCRLLKYYAPPPKGTKRIVEPYMGSCAYGLNSGLSVCGYDANSDLIEMWNWLKNAEESELRDLYNKVEHVKTLFDKPDVRYLKLSKGAETYVRINAASVMVGQLSSWKIYPQNRLPVESTIECLPAIRKRVRAVRGLASDYEDREGDCVFIDPPYVGTHANYSDSSGNDFELKYSPADTIKLIERLTSPIIFTYGDGAPELFPGYDWKVIAIRKVPNVRKGGTIDRKEYVAYINW